MKKLFFIFTIVFASIVVNAQTQEQKIEQLTLQVDSLTSRVDLLWHGIKMLMEKDAELEVKIAEKGVDIAEVKANSLDDIEMLFNFIKGLHNIKN